MSRRYSVYLGLIAFLVLVILGRWWLNSGKIAVGMGTGESATRSKVFLPGDFRLHMDIPAASEPHRDLFRAKGDPFQMDTNHVRQAKVKPALLPPANPVQNEADADSGLGKFKLLGVVFRADKGQVYLALNKESVIAHAGDTVLGQYTVDKIAVDSVELRDLKTNTIRRIPVSGK